MTFPLSHPLLNAKADDGIEQLHLQAASAHDITIQWTTTTVSEPSVAFRCSARDSAWDTIFGQSDSYSVLRAACVTAKVDPIKNLTVADNYTTPECFYTSEAINTVHLTGLLANCNYEYKIGATNKTRTFKTPPDVNARAIRFGLMGDIGQTNASLTTMRHMMAHVSKGEVDMILNMGDLSYSDGVPERWDSFGRLSEFLFSSLPVAHIGGNHETVNGEEQNIGYTNRYQMQHWLSGSSSILWYSLETGPAHVIALSSYSYFHAGSLQYQWLLKDLARIDRHRTPWVVMIVHAPWYSSNLHHPMAESAEMVKALEPLITDAQIDIVFNGHVHGYERTYPVVANRTDCSGPVYITIGDGGNREGFAMPWDPEQPSWSAYREFSYGHGIFDINNSTTAQWTWYRNQDTTTTPTERVQLSTVAERKRTGRC